MANLKIKKTLILLLAFILLLSINFALKSNSDKKVSAQDLLPPSEATELILTTSGIVIDKEGTYNITQEVNEISAKITITASSTIYIKNIKTSFYEDNCIKIINGADVKLIMYGNSYNCFIQQDKNDDTPINQNNYLLSSSNTGLSAIYVATGSHLTISSLDEESSLFTQGARGYSESDSKSHGGGGSGIGGNGGYNKLETDTNCGAITINSGVITAQGGLSATYWGTGGNGIGAGGTSYNLPIGVADAITINGGIINAEGGAGCYTSRAGAGIGKGLEINEQTSDKIQNIEINGGIIKAITKNYYIEESNLIKTYKLGVAISADNVIVDNFNSTMFPIFDCYNFDTNQTEITILSKGFNAVDKNSEELIVALITDDTIIGESMIDALIDENYVSLKAFNDTELCLFAKRDSIIQIGDRQYKLIPSPIAEDNYYIGELYGDSKKFRVTFDYGVYNVDYSQVLMATAIPNELPYLIMDGYSFGGWYIDSKFTYKAIAGQPLNGDTVIYAKWTKNHIHSFTEWEIVKSEDGTKVIRTRSCECGLIETEEIEIQEEVVETIDKIIEQPTEEILVEVKQELNVSITKKVRECDGESVKKVIGEFSGRIDEYELDDSVGDNLLKAYATALFDVRLEKGKQQLLLTMADEFNTANTSGNYTKDSLLILRASYVSIESKLNSTNIIDAINQLNQEWQKAKALLKSKNIVVKNGSIYCENGFDTNSELTINKIKDSEILLVDKQQFGVFDIAFTQNGSFVDNFNEKITVRVLVDGDLSKIWKVKAYYQNDSGKYEIISGKISGNYVVFDSNKLGEFVLVYEYAYPIFAFILIGVVLVGLVIVFIVARRKEKGGYNSGR